MMIMIAAALAAAPTAATAAPADPHAQHQQQHKGQKPEGCCCCKDKAGHKMEGSAEHGEAHGGEHAEHGATR